MANPWQLAAEAMRFWLQMGEMMTYAGMTIAARVSMMQAAAMGGRKWPVAEMTRMVAEKQQAAMTSALAALKPYHKATRANARRLARQR